MVNIIMVQPIGSIYGIYGNIYHQYTPFFVSIYTSTMDPLGQSGNLCLGHLLVPQTVCRWEVHDIHVILAG